MLRFKRLVPLSIASGILAGLAATVFLYLLEFATNARLEHPIIIWALPLAGLAIGWLYNSQGQDVAAGHNLILEEIHDPKNVVPVKMAPFILLSTVFTHLFGGSAGREGTAVQMGATLSDQLSKYVNLTPTERKNLLIAGAGAGFAAAIGTPIAGIIFGMEVVHVGKLKISAWLESIIACYVAYYTSVLLKAPHSVFPHFEIPSYTFLNIKMVLYLVLAGMVFGLSAKYFIRLTHYIEKRFFSWIKSSPLKPFFGGLLLVILFRAEGSYRFAGLGIEFIQRAFEEQASYVMPLYKAIFTALTLASGFKGGEFIPLVFIGTTLGSALSLALPLSMPLLAALGFAAVFAGASNTPIACSFMAAEIFGFDIFPYALLVCFLSYYFSGEHGIYRSQRKGPKCILGTKLRSVLTRLKQ